MYSKQILESRRPRSRITDGRAPARGGALSRSELAPTCREDPNGGLSKGGAADD